MNVAALRFLAVEDHEFQQKVLLRILAGLGATQVSVAADGREALTIVAAPESPIDIIISDLDMPGMDGAEFMRHLGAARAPVAIILASALGGFLLTTVEKMTRDYGVRILGVIEKPITPAKLAALIELYEPERRAPRGVWTMLKTVPSLVLKVLAGWVKVKLGEWSRIALRTPPVDRAVLAAISGGDPLAEREILSAFRRVTDDDAVILTLAVGRRDAAQVTSSTDRIAGASRSVGALALGQACERVGRGGAIGDWDAVDLRMRAFKRELARLDSFCEAEKCTSAA